MALSLGATTLAALYLGSTAISTAYLGSVQVYDAGGAFTPASLFASGEEGAWYEPSTTTCFTDTAGTIAATYGDAVARVNDLSGNGNHATQGTEAARPILARVPSGGRRNLLERTEEFDNAYWNTSSGSDSAEHVQDQVDIYGNANSAWTISDTDTSLLETIRSTLVVSADTTTYVASVFIKKTVSATSFPLLALVFTGGTVVSSSYVFDTDNGVMTVRSGATGTGGSVEDYSSSYWRVSWSITNNSTNNTLRFDIYPAATTVTDGTGVSTSVTGSIVAFGPQLEEGSTATAYQKVVDQYDITEAGVTSLEYLAFDGSDDGMATASIDFTATDKMSVFAGVEKESDTATTPVAEFSDTWSGNSNAGTFAMFSNTGGGAEDWSSGARGSADFAATQKAFSNDAQDQLVVASGLHDISGDSSILRLNGAQVDEATGDKGAGNFGNYPLYVGARGGSSLFFNGKLFSLIVRGAASTAQEISDTETYLAAKSGVTIP